MEGPCQDGPVDVSINQFQEDAVEKIFGVCRDLFLGLTNVNEMKYTIQVGFVSVVRHLKS